MEHTEGPWRYELQRIINEIGNLDSGYHTVPNYFHIAGGNGNMHISRGDQSDNGFSITGFMPTADARLMAAAPDLLEALETLNKAFDLSNQKYADWIPTMELNAAFQLCQSAIAKAKS